MSTPGAIRIEDRRIGRSVYLYTRYDGQDKGPVGLGEFLKGFLPLVLGYLEKENGYVDAADIANQLMGLSREYRKNEELELILPKDDDDWYYGDYNYHIVIKTKKFKSLEYPVVTVKLEEEDRERTLYKWEGGEE